MIYDIDRLNPISLTQDICGDEYYKGPINLSIELYLTTSDRYYDSIPIGDATRSIEYLHQLQNLYHALTGKKLDVDLNFLINNYIKL